MNRNEIINQYAYICKTQHWYWGKAVLHYFEEQMTNSSFDLELPYINDIYLTRLYSYGRLLIFLKKPKKVVEYILNKKEVELIKPHIPRELFLNTVK